MLLELRRDKAVRNGFFLFGLFSLLVAVDLGENLGRIGRRSWIGCLVFGLARARLRAASLAATRKIGEAAMVCLPSWTDGLFMMR